MDPDRPAEAEAAPTAIRFRQGKKRKGYRQRGGADDDEEQSQVQPRTETLAQSQSHAQSESRPEAETTSAPGDDQEDEPDSAVAAAIRARNAARRPKLQGVGFRSNGGGRQHDESSSEAALAKRDQDGAESVVRGISDRFMHQTGFVSDANDRHMTAYIESRLSNRPAASSSSPSKHPSDATATADNPSQHAPTQTHGHATFEPTRTGKLVEVQVPSDASRGNGTQRAGSPRKRRGEEGDGSSARRPKNQHRRRGSDDAKRDEMVDAFLHENRLDVYDLPAARPPPPSGTSANDDPSTGPTADDRLAEEFRRQYMEEMAQRRQRRRPAAAQKPSSSSAGGAGSGGPPGSGSSAAGGDVLKGPKLGGSRNVRAQVRDILLMKQEQEKGRRR